MTEKQVRKLVKIAYDKAVLEGKCGFGIEDLKGWYIDARDSTLGDRYVTLHFPGGWTTLKGGSFPRSVIIDVFAEFIWNWNRE